MLGQTIKEINYLISLFNNMTQPNDNSFYVTLTSQKTQEFPDNLPTQFQYRLPQSLWLPGKWKVGLASVFLPGVSNPIPHIVTSHVSSSLTKHHDTNPTKPFGIRSNTKGAIPIFYFNNMPKLSNLVNLKNFCPNLKQQICKMPPMDLILCPKFFGGWNRI